MSSSSQVCLGDIALSMQSGFACGKSNLVEDGLLHLRPFNIGFDGELDLTQQYRIPVHLVPDNKKSTLVLKAGDILFNNTNSLDLVGKVAVVREDLCATFSNHLTRIRIKRDRGIPMFVGACLRRLWKRGYFRHHCTQWVNQAAYGPRLLNGLRLSLPPLAEQRRIVGILNRAARIERLRKRAQERLQEFIPALFVKMFGDPATNPRGWDVRELSALSIVGPQYGANARSAPLVDGQPRYIRISDIGEDATLTDLPVGVDDLDHDQYLLMDGDLLFARSGATVGKPYLYCAEDGPCVFAGYLIRFRLDTNRILPSVLFAFTRTTFYLDWVKNKRRTAAQPNINGREYGALPVLVPPMPLQNWFASAYDRIHRIAGRKGVANDAVSSMNTVLASQLIGNK